MSQCKCNLPKLAEDIGDEYTRTHWIKLAVDEVNCRTLYKCPDTGRYWKEYYPYPEYHGGGPSAFVQISKRTAKEEFGFEE